MLSPLGVNLYTVVAASIVVAMDGKIVGKLELYNSIQSMVGKTVGVAAVDPLLIV